MSEHSKSTQISYPTLALLAQHSQAPANAVALRTNSLFQLVLVNTTAAENTQLHHLRDGCVVLYKRGRSDVWQVRFKLFDQKWHRATTRHRDLAFAKRVAGDLYDRAKFREEMGIPQVTKRFGVVAEECLKRLDEEIAAGLRPMTNRDYQRVIRNYLMPYFGKTHLLSIDSKLVREYEVWRNTKIGHMPIASTLMTHCAAYNRVLDLAVEQGWLSPLANVARLSRRGPKSRARPGFTAAEIQHMTTFMATWTGGHRDTSRQFKLLLRDYVEMLLATGMRCGKESMNMLWQHIEWHRDGQQRYLRIWVSGKTGGRWLIAKHWAAEALGRLALRQTDVAMTLDEVIAAKLPAKVFRLDTGAPANSLHGTFRKMLLDAGLSKDATTGQQRTLYSLRHCYATQELLGGTDIHTLARQMGTSVTMLERHYSKLTATMAAGQLA